MLTGADVDEIVRDLDAQITAALSGARAQLAAAGYRDRALHDHLRSYADRLEAYREFALARLEHVHRACCWHAKAAH